MTYSETQTYRYESPQLCIRCHRSDAVAYTRPSAHEHVMQCPHCGPVTMLTANWLADRVAAVRAANGLE